MRTLLRTALVTMVVVFSGLIIWSLARNANVTQSAQAAPATPTIPEHCVKDLQEWLAKPRSPQERQTAVQAELQCAADAQTYPSQKQTALAKITPLAPRPTRHPVTPRPTATIQVGLQNGDFNPYTQDPFLPVDKGNNLWVGIINGKVISVFAGYLNNEQENEDWQTQPDWVAHGAVWVWVSDSKNSGVIYPTLMRHGEVHFIAACGAMLFLQATDDTVFAFDAAKQAYVSNAFMACPTATLRVGIMDSTLLYTNHFVITDHPDNSWQNIINGKVTRIYAGALYEQDNFDHSNQSLQGLVFVKVENEKGKIYPTTARHGDLHFIAACGTKLTLQATDGTIFVFDAATQSYLNSNPACPTVTP